jgi:hypothetical protein
MSFQAMTWAVNVQTESAGQKLVLLMLANYCNGHTGQCNPSQKRLAQECCMGLSTLKNHIANLERQGFLKVVSKSVDGVSLPNQYLLKIDGVGQNLTEGQPESDGGVGQNLTEGWARNWLQTRNINQEYKPGSEPKGDAQRKRSAPATSVQCPDDVDQQTWTDWRALRKAKRAPVTETVVAGARREAQKAGMSLQAFFEVWCTRGSQGLQADWLKPAERAPGAPVSFAEQDRMAKRRTWEEMTGRKWPEASGRGDVIDLAPDESKDRLMSAHEEGIIENPRIIIGQEGLP